MYDTGRLTSYFDICSDMIHLHQNGFNSANASRGSLFFDDFESLAVFDKLMRVIDVRAATDFKTERTLGWI